MGVFVREREGEKTVMGFSQIIDDNDYQSQSVSQCSTTAGRALRTSALEHGTA